MNRQISFCKVRDYVDELVSYPRGQWVSSFWFPLQPWLQCLPPPPPPSRRLWSEVSISLNSSIDHKKIEDSLSDCDIYVTWEKAPYKSEITIDVYGCILDCDAYWFCWKIVGIELIVFSRIRLHSVSVVSDGAFETNAVLSIQTFVIKVVFYKFISEALLKVKAKRRIPEFSPGPETDQMTRTWLISYNDIG